MRSAGGAALAGGLLLAGCAGMIGEARMRPLTASPGAVEEVALTGIGGWRSGSFALGGLRGSFRRSADRPAWGVLGHDVATNMGTVAFSATGPGLAGTLAAACRYDQRDVGLGEGVRVTVAPLVLQCDFTRDGAPIDAALELHERGAFRDERAGRVALEGARLELRSVHELAGTPVTTITPVGYVFLLDGREVGGIDLSGGTRRVMLPRDSRLRPAAIAAALTLAIFWDPQSIGLEDSVGN